MARCGSSRFRLLHNIRYPRALSLSVVLLRASFSFRASDLPCRGRRPPRAAAGGSVKKQCSQARAGGGTPRPHAAADRCWRVLTRGIARRTKQRRRREAGGDGASGTKVVFVVVRKRVRYFVLCVSSLRSSSADVVPASGFRRIGFPWRGWPRGGRRRGYICVCEYDVCEIEVSSTGPQVLRPPHFSRSDPLRHRSRHSLDDDRGHVGARRAAHDGARETQQERRSCVVRHDHRYHRHAQRHPKAHLESESAGVHVLTC